MFHQQTCRIFTLCSCVCVEDQCCWWSPSSSWGQMFSVQLMWREMLDLWLALFFQSMILTMLSPVQVCFHWWNRLSAAAGQRRNTNIHHRFFHTGHRNMNTWHLSSVSNVKETASTPVTYDSAGVTSIHWLWCEHNLQVNTLRWTHSGAMLRPVLKLTMLHRLCLFVVLFLCLLLLWNSHCFRFLHFLPSCDYLPGSHVSHLCLVVSPPGGVII